MARTRRRRRPAKKHVLLLARARPHYDRLLEFEGGGCAICGKPPSPTRRLDLDHDHGRMFVRGLLCPGCNIRLGRETNPEWLRRAAAYLERGPILWLEAAMNPSNGG